MEKELTNVQITLTEKCNFKCEYCFASKNGKTIKFDDLIKLADFIVTYDTKKCNINFFGGEPMVMYEELILPFIEYMNKVNYEGNYSIVTNGSLLNKDILDFMIKQNFSIMISLDGNYKTFSKNRNSDKAIYDKILNNIDYLVSLNYINFEVRLTYTEKNIDDLFDNVKFIYSLGIKKIQIYHEYDISVSKDNLRRLKDQFEHILKFYIKNSDLKMYFIERILHFYFNHNTYERELCSKCGLIDDNEFSFSVDTNGNYYTCHHFNSQEEMYKEFNIGNVNNGLDLKKIESLSKLNLIKNNLEHYLEREKKCLNCELYKMCSSHCIMQNLKLNKNIFINDSVACDINLLMFTVIKENLNNW